MAFFMVAASHSPLLDFPARESSSVRNILAALDASRSRIEAFNPDLAIVFGVDHYGGHHMDCMPSFCVGVEATAMSDVGGTPVASTSPVKPPSRLSRRSAPQAWTPPSPMRWTSTMVSRRR